MRDKDSHAQPGGARKGLLQISATWRELRTEDRMLALLRAAAFAGAAAWTAFAPMSPSVRSRCALLLGIFLAYGVALLWLVRRWPRRARATYLGALAADLGFLYFLFGATGGVASPFLPAVFLLTALTAFHYGPWLGVVSACVALMLAAVSDAAALGGHWGEFFLIAISAILTAAYVGWLARRAAQERRDV